MDARGVRAYQKRRADPATVERYRQRSKEYMAAVVTSEKRMLASAKGRAKAQGLAFDIDMSDIVIPAVCPLLSIPIVEHKGQGVKGPQADSPSLDRIDPKKGYVKGNVWVVSYRANAIKQNATAAELRRMADALDAIISP